MKRINKLYIYGDKLKYTENSFWIKIQDAILTPLFVFNFQYRSLYSISSYFYSFASDKIKYI
jgi:hypothetical protein